MEVLSSEMSVTVYQITPRHIPEGRSLYSHSGEKINFASSQHTLLLSVRIFLLLEINPKSKEHQLLAFN